MLGKTRTLAVAALVLVLGGAQVARAQDAPPIVSRQMVTPPDSVAEVSAPAAAVASAPATWMTPYRLAPLDESSFPPLAGDPLLDDPHFPPPGFFADVDVTAVGTHFKNRVFGSVPLTSALTDTIHVPGAQLDWTAAPSVELGYRLSRGFGEFLFSYKSLVTEGNTDLAPDAGNAHLHSRLNVNQADFDYANYHDLAPGWDLRWRVGVQLTAAYYDSRSAQPITTDAGMVGVNGQRFSNNFVGAGPHAGLEIWRHLEAMPGLSCYLNVEGAAPWGQLHQSFEETIALPGVLVGGASRTSLSQALGVVAVEAGLCWTPPNWSTSRFTLGYHFEVWYQLGRDDNTDSMGSLTEHGIFFRAQFNF
jgi:hypothetical protein